jgi:hypothetical protein
MSSTQYNYDTFQAYLQEACRCKYVGKVMPRPYMSEDDMPDLYKSPTGNIFMVPLPDMDTGLYEDFVVEEIMIKNSLEPALQIVEELVQD